MKKFLVKRRTITDQWLLVDAEDEIKARAEAQGKFESCERVYHEHITTEFIVNPVKVPKKAQQLFNQPIKGLKCQMP